MSKAKLTKEEVSTIIKPIIKEEEGTKHPLSILFTQKPELLQELTSVGLFRLPDTNKFISYTIKSKGTEVISIEVSEPDLRAICEETSKIAFVENFMSKEF